MQYPDFWLGVVTVAQVYGVSDPVIPEGYEPTGEFRHPSAAEDEYFLGAGLMGFSTVSPSKTNFSLREPRIILRLKSKRKVRTFTHTGNFVYHVTKGQWYYWPDSDMYYPCMAGGLNFTRGKGVELVTRTESEV